MKDIKQEAKKLTEALLKRASSVREDEVPEPPPFNVGAQSLYKSPDAEGASGQPAPAEEVAVKSEDINMKAMRRDANVQEGLESHIHNALLSKLNLNGYVESIETSDETYVTVKIDGDDDAVRRAQDFLVKNVITSHASVKCVNDSDFWTEFTRGECPLWSTSVESQAKKLVSELLNTGSRNFSRSRDADELQPTKVELQSKCDHIKGNWFEWYCTAVFSDGSTREGTVQADGSGESVALETFEEDPQ